MSVSMTRTPADASSSSPTVSALAVASSIWDISDVAADMATSTPHRSVNSHSFSE
jgi:hypothetical protein